MSTGFVCWDPASENEPGAEPRPCNRVPDVLSVEDAAEVYAERIHPDSDYPDELTLKVRDPDGQTHTVKVTVEYCAEFYARVQP